MAKGKYQVFLSGEVEAYIEDEIKKAERVGYEATVSIICQRELLKVAKRAAKKVKS